MHVKIDNQPGIKIEMKYDNKTKEELMDELVELDSPIKSGNDSLLESCFTDRQISLTT